LLQQIKIYAQTNFIDYVNKKKKRDSLISQNNPAIQSQIDNLQRQIENDVKYSKYKNAKQTLDGMTKKYLGLLSDLQSQREAMESDKDKIQKVLGGDNKYKAVIKHFPTDKGIQNKQEFITTLQSLVE
jgi:hypothetical protein